ncbi:MAG TPA: ABC transporter substrate-binding protein [Kofleriaceae bacterium]|nr:ABC transporter substrate-binding protein [Kofleriaceae bacterium]
MGHHFSHVFSRSYGAKARARRIVSLLPSATEIVCAAGAVAELVGVSHECDFPADVRGRPVVTSSRIAAGGSSLSIDTQVRGVLRDALSIYEVDEELLARLAPDVVVTQDLCEVCAVSLEDVRRALARLGGESVRLVSLRPTRLADVLGDIVRVGEAIGRSGEARAVRARLQHRIDAIAARAAQAGSRPRVASIEWIEPVMLGGTWMPELIELAGGVAVGATPGMPAPTVAPEELAGLRPDVVLVKPCGFTLERALSEHDVIDRAIARHAGAEARICVTDGSAFFNRPGPRLVESLEIMAACLHPALFADLADKHAQVMTWLR